MQIDKEKKEDHQHRLHARTTYMSRPIKAFMQTCGYLAKIRSINKKKDKSRYGNGLLVCSMTSKTHINRYRNEKWVIDKEKKEDQDQEESGSDRDARDRKKGSIHRTKKTEIKVADHHH